MTLEKTEPELKHEESIPFYPDHVRSEARVVIAIVALVLIIAVIGMVLPVGLGEPANPLDTPTHVKPEWYFLFFYQALKFIPKICGGVALVLMPLLILLLPFLDQKPDRTNRTIRTRFIVVVIGVIILIVMTIWGEVS
jgi:quinol-cytochrome oxidoreductase complex cytochrome b subunit